MNLWTLGILLAVSIGLVLYSLMPRKRDGRDAVKRRLAGGRGVDEIAEIRERARSTATAQLVKRATPMLSKLVLPSSDQDQNMLRLKLANAGYRQAGAQTIFLASKSVLAIVGLLVAAFVALSVNAQLTTLLGLVAFGAGAGFMLPNFWLSVASGGRKQKIRHGLPDTLDLLVVSVESGLALDAAIKRVGEEMALVHHDLSEEMRIATMETQMGIPRGEALENMARRCGVEEMRSLVTVVLQAEKFGTSIAKALRNQADTLRTKRHQAAEERAQKTAVKLMIPLVLFIFPAMGVVLAGPAALKMLAALRDNPTLN
ncbi:MAG: type II secretion system F family protein [Phycisphaerae bacterium]|jgi:tight adherence protein C